MHDDPSIWALPCANNPIAWTAAIMAALKLLALAGPLAFFARRAAGRLLPEGGAPQAAAALLIAFAAIAAGSWVLPLRYGWMLAFALVLAAAALLIPKPRAEPGIQDPGDHLVWAGYAAVILAALAAAALHPYFPHDPLTYQLYHPAQWIAQGRISIVPTPFGDPSHAYGPQVASTFFAWLMVPLGADLLAQTGGLFFLLLALAAVSGLARELGASRRQASYAGLLLIASAAIMTQAMSALNDLATAAFAAAAVLFLLRAARRATAADLFLGLTALGLTAGVKYTGAPIVLLLAPLLIPAARKVRGPRAAAAWSAGIAVAIGAGGVWHLRNLIVTGNPVFPLTVNLGGHEIFAGLYGAGQMSRWVYHQEGAAEWLKIIIAVPGLPLLVLGLPAMAFAVWTAARDHKPGGRALAIALAYAALLPLIMDRVLWPALPFQVDRFWLPPTVILMAVTAALLARRPWALAAGAALCWAGSFWPAAMENAPATAILVLRFMPVIFLLGLAAGKGIQRLSLTTPKARPILTAIASLALAVLLVLALRDYPRRRAQSLELWPFAKAASSLPCPNDGLTVAYAGANTPYPLLGAAYNNRILYLSLSGRIMPKDHEFIQVLAGERFNTPEPMVSSLQICPQKWARALVESKADLLFVMKVPTLVLINVPHTRDGWPIEDDWARQMPGFFKLLYQDQFARIYRVKPEQKGEAAILDPSCRQRAVDAFAACRGSSLVRGPDCETYFPQGPEAIRALNLAP